MLFLLFLGTAFAQTVTYSLYSPSDGSATIGSCQELVFDDSTCTADIFGRLSDALTTSGWSQGACTQATACPQAIQDLMNGLDFSGIYGMYCTNGGSDLTFNFYCEAASSSDGSGTVTYHAISQPFCQDFTMNAANCGVLSSVMSSGSEFSTGSCADAGVAGSCPSDIQAQIQAMNMEAEYSQYCVGGSSGDNFSYGYYCGSSSGGTDCSLDSTCGDSCSGDPTTCAELQTMADGCASSCSQCTVDLMSDQLGCQGDERATAGSNASVLSLATLVALGVYLF